MMRLTVLGNFGSFPGKDGACSGYLLEVGSTRVLLDCGSGVISRLQRYCDVGALSAVVVSHLHSDHAGDLMILRYGLETRQAFGERLPPLPLYLPASPSSCWDELSVGTALSLHPITAHARVVIGDLNIQFVPMEHTIESYAMVIAGLEKKMVYSGDTSSTHRLVEAARSADLLLCEATRLERCTPSPVRTPHITARMAAEAALQAQVSRLLLTHFWYQEDPKALLAQAKSVFPNTALAEEFVTYQI